MTLKLGEMLLSAGKITSEQLEEALQHQREHGGKIGEVLVHLGFVKNEDIINEFIAKQLNIGRIRLSDIDLNPDVVNLIPVETAKKYTVIAAMQVGKVLFVATSDPKNVFVLDTLKFITGFEVQPVLASREDISSAIDKYYGLTEEEDLEELTAEAAEDLEVVEEEEDEEISGLELEKAIRDKPLVRLVDSIIMDAVKMKASDIHVETYQNTIRVRYRIDGVLHEVSKLPHHLRYAIVSRIKILAGLDISERRLPQDGRIKMKVGKKKIELRVSTIPCIFGERVMMRVLDPESLMLDITKLGFPKRGLKLFNKAIHLPYGMILVTGPSGCGKTTTLYSAIVQLNTPDVNISTAEDPVEFNIDGVNQVQVHPEIGLTFASALRSFLRQDPNIILVGEIRDLETADIAIKAALTGHLVFSTLHTNDAPSTVTRLINMGVPPFLVSSAVKLVISQRLMRKLCENCKEECKPEPELLEIVGISEKEIRERNLKFYRGAGCPSCGHTGYKGRIAVFEMMPITKEIQKLINEGATAVEIAEQMRKMGLKTLRQEAVDRMLEGKTTIEQVISETTD